MVSWLQNCLRLSWTTSSAWKCSKFYRLVLVLPTDSVYPEISSSSVHFKYHIHCSRPSRHHLIETILYELATLSDVTDKLEDVAITWQPNGPRRAHRSGSHCTEVHGVQQTWSLEVKQRESIRVPKIWESIRRRGAQNIIWSSLYFISLLLSFTCLFTMISLNYYGNKNWDVRTENLKNMVAFAHSRAAEDYKHRSVNDCQRARQRFSQRKTTTFMISDAVCDAAEDMTWQLHDHRPCTCHVSVSRHHRLMFSWDVPLDHVHLALSVFIGEVWITEFWVRVSPRILTKDPRPRPCRQ